ncbi:MAG: lipid A biosynthesis acyltransferase [Bacteroidota bacterium]
MPSWKGQTRGGVLGYKIFVGSIRYLGISFAYFLLRFVVVYFVFTSGKAFHSLYQYFTGIHHYGRIRAIVSIFRNYYIFGQILIDKVVLLAGFSNKFTFDFDGEEYLRQMDKGGLLISGHIGNWEVAGQLLNRLEKKINVLVFDAEHEQIKRYLNDVVNRKVNFIIIREDFSHLAEIKTAFEHGEIIAMHGDRFIEGNKVVAVDFLGKPALFALGPINLAARFHVPVSFVFAIKENKHQYHFYATPLQMIEFSNNLKKRESFLRNGVVDYVRNLEKIVMKYPTHWFNYYDFWDLSAMSHVKPMS